MRTTRIYPISDITANHLVQLYLAVVIADIEQHDELTQSVANEFFCYMQNGTRPENLAKDIDTLKEKGFFSGKLSNKILDEIILKIVGDEKFISIIQPAAFRAQVAETLDQFEYALNAYHVEKFYLIVETVADKNNDENSESKASGSAALVVKNFLTNFRAGNISQSSITRLRFLKEQHVFAGQLPAGMVDDIIEKLSNGKIFSLIENNAEFCEMLEGKASKVQYNSYAKVKFLLSASQPSNPKCNDPIALNTIMPRVEHRSAQQNHSLPAHSVIKFSNDSSAPPPPLQLGNNPRNPTPTQYSKPWSIFHPQPETDAVDLNAASTSFKPNN